MIYFSIVMILTLISIILIAFKKQLIQIVTIVYSILYIVLTIELHVKDSHCKNL